MTALVILLFLWEFSNLSLSAPLYCKSLALSFRFASFPLSFTSSLSFLYGLNSFPSGFKSHAHGQIFKSMGLIWVWSKTRSMLQTSGNTHTDLCCLEPFSPAGKLEKDTNTNAHTHRAQTYPVPSALSSALSKLTRHLNPAQWSQSLLVPVDLDPQLLASYLGGEVNKRKAKVKIRHFSTLT